MKTEPTAVIPAFARMTVIGKINALPKIIKLENLTLVGRLKWQKQNTCLRDSSVRKVIEKETGKG